MEWQGRRTSTNIDDTRPNAQMPLEDVIAQTNRELQFRQQFENPSALQQIGDLIRNLQPEYIRRGRVQELETPPVEPLSPERTRTFDMFMQREAEKREHAYSTQSMHPQPPRSKWARDFDALMEQLDRLERQHPSGIDWEKLERERTQSGM